MYTVLVVDDSPDSLSLINDILEKEGISTLVALEGSQAITIAEQIKPDIILLDAVMPKMDGFETCIRLKQNRLLNHIPVVFMTGLKESDNVLKGLNAGGVDYITKPVNPEELIARIKTHINNAQITSSAQKALDSIGQTLFSVSKTGQLMWATPQTHNFLSTIPHADDWLSEQLLPFVADITRGPVKNGSTFKLKYEGGSCELALVSSQPSGDCTFRIGLYTETLTGEEVLKSKLSITSRESEVLYWLSNGKTNKEIAIILNIGSRTVNKHLEQVFSKLGVENRTTAAGIAIRTLAQS
ncbi:response regulator [uncultured Paraglaciecola sp.]|uniref:response regulator n=1 Tax=uncultured Paraglaciecola sp. TaxID=1765024 RepID=UPI0030DA854A|tara:strand:- start:21662 stop:22555 length:894 start_codon:yes stop_codon:yes gene_type:complete